MKNHGALPPLPHTLHGNRYNEIKMSRQQQLNKETTAWNDQYVTSQAVCVHMHTLERTLGWIFRLKTSS